MWQVGGICRHNITEILLKVALSAITLTHYIIIWIPSPLGQYLKMLYSSTSSRNAAVFVVQHHWDM